MMRCVYYLSLAVCATVGLEVALILLPDGPESPADTGTPSPFELCARTVTRNAFPSRDVQMRLAEELPHTMEESKRRREQRLRDLKEAENRNPSREHRFMGWRVSDQVYWTRIPADARRLPVDWSRLPALRFTNTDIGGDRELRLFRGPEYDQWLLSDPEHDLSACISVHRQTRAVYFMEVTRQRDGTWGYSVAFDKCYSCHASGPRVIRPFDDPRVDRSMLTRFNRLVLAYGACDFGDSVDPALRGERHADTRCASCHDGRFRGQLYTIHERSIEFKTRKEMTMPP